MWANHRHNDATVLLDVLAVPNQRLIGLAMDTGTQKWSPDEGT